jgi:hypothetical protein
VIDAKTQKIEKQFGLDGEAYMSVLSTDAKELYISCWGCDHVLVFDLNMQAWKTPIKVGDNPNEMLISPNGQQLYVCNANDNTVSVINLKTKKVIGVGRNFLRENPFSLNITSNNNYQYYSRHIYHEQDLLLEMLDLEKPEIIINFAAQGEGAVSWKHSWRFFETNSVALSKLCEQLSTRKW